MPSLIDSERDDGEDRSCPTHLANIVAVNVPSYTSRRRSFFFNQRGSLGLCILHLFLWNIWGAIHQLLSIILKLRILVLLLVSTIPYVVIVKNYS
jgi:hypothetical protein